MIIKKEQSEIQNFLTDASNFRGYCDEVYFPDSSNDIIDLIKKANEEKIKVTISGNGTGLTGARVPEGGVVISTSKLNKVLEIDKEKKHAIVQPGVLLREFQDLLESQNLFYPPDPTERDCFIGATIATNSSGAKTFKYGSTRNYVLGLKLILPDGDVLTLERGKTFANGYNLNLKTDSGKEIEIIIPDYLMPLTTKHSAGYYCKKDMDAIDLFIGSEGTLGIVYETKLKLLTLPENILSSVVFFDKENDALNFIEEARILSSNSRKEKNENKINALGIEFFDKYSLKFLQEDYPQIPQDANAAVWFEQEYSSENEFNLFNEWIQLVHKHNRTEEKAWFAATKKDREKFQDFRHAVSWKVSEYITQKGITKVGTDVAVPHSRFINFYGDSKSLVESYNLNYIVYGHAGDSHLHLNMLPRNNNEFETAQKIYAEICNNAVKLQGTISAEHGIGKLKKEHLLKMFGEENIKKMARLKKILDPNKIFGIGNMFDEKFLN